jgi:hypothetical protein
VTSISTGIPDNPVLKGAVSDTTKVASVPGVGTSAAEVKGPSRVSEVRKELGEAKPAMPRRTGEQIKAERFVDAELNKYGLSRNQVVREQSEIFRRSGALSDIPEIRIPKTHDTATWIVKRSMQLEEYLVSMEKNLDHLSDIKFDTRDGFVAKECVGRIKEIKTQAMEAQKEIDVLKEVRNNYVLFEKYGPQTKPFEPKEKARKLQEILNKIKEYDHAFDAGDYN